MLSDKDNEYLTIIYGPIFYKNYIQLTKNPYLLARSNGLWKSILALSDFLLLDAPILKNPSISDIEEILDTSDIKRHYLGEKNNTNKITSKAFSSRPTQYHEDDVDTGIHFFFTELLKDFCFEGMCNPPGGDWSGFSVIHNSIEKRWLSLPRVSNDIEGKRPDHIIEIFGMSYSYKPVLLSIESKERSANLEENVGEQLKTYIHHLMSFEPNVEREFRSKNGWSKGTYVSKDEFITISAAAYLDSSSQPDTYVVDKSKCDMLFVLKPLSSGWIMKISPYTPEAKRLKAFFKEKIDPTAPIKIE